MIGWPELAIGWPESLIGSDQNRRSGGPGILIKTDVHGRFVVHLFYSSAAVSILDCFLHGAYLNDELLRAGHAELVS